MGIAKLDDDFIDEPEDIINGLIEERKKLLNGFGGNDKVDKKILAEAMIPSHYAISLSGEPTLYPKLPELITNLKNRPEVKTVFLVTNGLEPDMFIKLKESNSLPTQLYLSIEASNYDQHIKINRPKLTTCWESLHRTIEIMPTLDCRTIVRFTLIKGLNDDPKDIENFVKLFEKTNADFLEIKSYMFLGNSRKNLTIENMPSYEETLNYSKDLEKVSKLYNIEDICKPSRIILLKNINSKYENFIIPKNK
jgi:tRNA wybutosine-synthesizing protein 1